MWSPFLRTTRSSFRFDKRGDAVRQRRMKTDAALRRNATRQKEPVMKSSTDRMKP
jgi:hypothetical protein